MVATLCFGRLRLRYGTLKPPFARGIVLGAMWFYAITTGGAVAAAAMKVRVEPGQSLRDIARQQLGDPDLWTEILRANGLSSITEVQPGMELNVPAAEIASADRALRRALAA